MFRLFLALSPGPVLEKPLIRDLSQLQGPPCWEFGSGAESYLMESRSKSTFPAGPAPAPQGHSCLLLFFLLRASQGRALGAEGRQFSCMAGVCWHSRQLLSRLLS